MSLVQSNFCATVAHSRPLHLHPYQDYFVAWEVFEDTRQSQAQSLAPQSLV